MTPVNPGALIVGLGAIGMGYDLRGVDDRILTHARAFDRHPGFDLLGGVDPDAERRGLFEGTYGAPAFPSLDSALGRVLPDVVGVAVPTALHLRTVRQALATHLPKVILCEKPLSLDMSEARELVDLCARAGVSLVVNYFRRSDPGVKEVHRRILAGEIGAPLKGVSWYTKGFLHSASHLFNLLELWLGEPRSWRVLARGGTLPTGDAEVDVHVEFERGTAVILSAWEEAFSHHTIELLSPLGRLGYDDGGARVGWTPTQPDSRFEGYRRLAVEEERIESGTDRAQWHVAQAISEHLSGRPADLCSGAEALRTLSNMTKILHTGPG